MPFTSYSDLKTAVASFEHRSDTVYTSVVDDFIDLCEADMQAKLKLLEFESTASVTMTSGSGSLPSDYLGLRSAYWSGNTATPLDYVTPDRFDAMRNSTGGTPKFFTISGSTIRANEGASGTLVMTYLAKFTPLSGSNTSNSILSNHPDAYLYGTLYHSALWRGDDASAQKFQSLFGVALDRINRNNADRKYTGPLMVRPR